MNSTIRRIIVPLDPSEYAQAATESACHLAKMHRAQIGGIAVLDSPGIGSDLVPAVGPFYPGVANELIARIEMASDVVKDCQSRFAQTCEDFRAPHWEVQYEGIPAEKFLASSIFADLVVTGLRTSFHFETRGSDGPKELTEFLDQSVAPVLAVTADGLETIESVCMAFDGSHASARAMQDFVDVALPYSPSVTIVVSQKPEDEANFLLQESASFLRSHGIKTIETIASDSPIFETVDSLDVDLVVAGIHSKKPIKDWFVGSLVKDLVNKGEVALFLSH